MKAAELSNGHTIEFPDEAEDAHMDAAVNGYLTARGDIPSPKAADLPNGHTIRFPADAKDEHMDAAVQSYMAARGDIPPPVDPTIKMLEAIQQGFTDALTQMERGLQAKIAEMQQQNAEREKMFLRQIDEIRKRDESATKSIVEAQAQIAEIRQQNIQREHVFLRQLEEMRQRDENTTKELVEALMAPKHIVHDDAGRPVGVRVGN